MLCRCKCGNCSVILLANVSECYCCSELEGCLESMKSDLVLEDLAADVTLKCINYGAPRIQSRLSPEMQSEAGHSKIHHMRH